MTNPLQLLVLACGFMPSASASPHAQEALERVSVRADGSQSSGAAEQVAVSGDGRYVAFKSEADDLVAGDSNGRADVFVRERATGIVEQVSLALTGQPNGDSGAPSLSADGRYIVFESLATNLYALDVNGFRDVFLFDRQTGQLEPISVGLFGLPSNGDSRRPRVSADGRYVSFESSATNLIANGFSVPQQVFVRDRQTGTTEAVSRSSSGALGNGASWNGGLSADGRRIAFVSVATNLVASDTNVASDCFVRDLDTQTTRRVTVSDAGVQANGATSVPCTISSDGRFVAYSSTAFNLVPFDFSAGYDVFVHDLAASSTTMVSLNSQGFLSNGNSYDPTLSADGRVVAFQSFASNLDPVDLDQDSDIFVRDRGTGTTKLASRDLAGFGGDGNSFAPRLSGDGSLCVFHSTAVDLVFRDSNVASDAFSHEEGSSQATAYCFASASTCPCGNVAGPERGCDNSFATGGARLYATGKASVATDTLTLRVDGLLPAAVVLFFQGNAHATQQTFGDGLRCAGGFIRRLGTQSGSTGVASYGHANGGPSIAVRGGLPAFGGLRSYQAWYRDPQPYCTTDGFNLSNGVDVSWVP